MKAKRHPSIGLLVAAVVVFLFGIFLGNQSVTCGSQPMSPGDTCVRDGKSRSYAAEVRAQEQTPLRFGVISVGLVVVAVVVGLRRRPTEATGAGS